MKNKILVVDDEVNLRNSISLTLKAAGYSVDSAKDGREAFDKIRQSLKNDVGFDLIITEIMMPNLDGLNLITKLHRHNMWIPAIMINRHSEKNTVVKPLREGFVDYIGNPFEVAALIQSVNNLFGKHIRK